MSEKFRNEDAAMRIAFCALLLLAPSAAWGQVAQVKVCVRGGCGIGAAVNIGPMKNGRDAWLTAKHVVSSGRVQVAVSGQWHRARLLGVCPNADLALFSLRRVNPDYWCLADSAPPTGTRLSIYGYPHGQRQSGRRTAVFDNGGFRGTVYVGDSGGPLVHDKRVVGIISGYYASDRRRISAARLSRTRRFVKNTLGYIPRCHRPEPTRPPKEPPEPQPGTNPGCDCGDVSECDCGNVEGRLTAIEGRQEKIAAAQAETARLLSELRAEMESKIAAVEKQKGPRGPPGEKGERGPPGTITIVIREDGEQLYKLEHVKAGSDVQIPIQKIREEQE